jgi:hypothetical protein
MNKEQFQKEIENVITYKNYDSETPKENLKPDYHIVENFKDAWISYLARKIADFIWPQIMEKKITDLLKKISQLESLVERQRIEIERLSNAN